ncbi:MAG: replication/maintenance protein RepL [Plesiomonas sp.]|uniref:replication/maintenance protein RepL n=1 Tax=Plesiomonas sp. TaxID=2486279 RepID=UPI003F3116EE
MSTEENSGDNSNFVQLSRVYLKQWGQLVETNPLGARILFFFLEKMGRTTNAVVCSYKALGELTGYSRTSIAVSIKKLKEDKWIDTVKIGSATAYCVNERVAWQAKKHERCYAMFSATVIATESEQPSDFNDKAKEKLTYIPIVEIDERIVVGNDELPPPDQQDIDLN